VYSGTGFSAVHGQQVANAQMSHNIAQYVVLFPTERDAASFFAASAQSWPACSNTTFTENLAGKATTFSVGPVSNTNGVLSANVRLPTNVGPTCQRALTVAGNVIVDVTGCSTGQSDTAVVVARQIAAKVPTL
jgi:hypothetical protein